MTAIELKHSIHNSIDTIQDETILKVIFAMVSEFSNGEIEGTLAGNPLTRADILRRSIEAENDIREGRVYSLEQIKEKLKTGFGRK